MFELQDVYVFNLSIDRRLPIPRLIMEISIGEAKVSPVNCREIQFHVFDSLSVRFVTSPTLSPERCK